MKKSKNESFTLSSKETPLELFVDNQKISGLDTITWTIVEDTPSVPLVIVGSMVLSNVNDWDITLSSRMFDLVVIEWNTTYQFFNVQVSQESVGFGHELTNPIGIAFVAGSFKRFDIDMEVTQEIGL